MDPISPGYWNRPDATAEAFVDDWLRTGAASVMTKGFITSSIAGKICTSRVAKTSTQPKLSVVYQLPGIVEAAIVGVPDSKWGESGVAVVVLA